MMIIVVFFIYQNGVGPIHDSVKNIVLLNQTRIETCFDLHFFKYSCTVDAIVLKMSAQLLLVFGVLLFLPFAIAYIA